MPIYTLRVYTGKETLVTEKIKELSLDSIKEIHNPLSIYNTPVFPGYIFLDTGLDSATYYAVLKVPFTIYFLSPISGVFPISEAEGNHVELLDNESSAPVELAGLNVEIINGRYGGLSGVLQKVDYPSAMVKVGMFNQEVVLKVNIKDLLVEGAPCLPESSVK